MKNSDFIKRLMAVGCSLSLAASLYGCINADSSNDLPKEESAEPDYTTEKVIEKTSEVIAPDAVVASLTSLDKPFRLKESFLDEDGNLVYEEFGPEFYEKEINGLKYLINEETKEVCISGYSNLGRLCLMRNLKSEQGGTDSDLGYSGYVLIAFYHVDGKNLFSLYDFDDFTPLLNMCDLSASNSFTNDIINLYYLDPYDPEYRGKDDDNEHAGYVFEVVKDGIRYLVDVNDFRKIVLSGNFKNYIINISSTGNATIRYYDYDSNEYCLYTSEQLTPYYSDVLQRTRTKNDIK